MKQAERKLMQAQLQLKSAKISLENKSNHDSNNTINVLLSPTATHHHDQQQQASGVKRNKSPVTEVFLK
jgi:hypothetical protein